MKEKKALGKRILLVVSLLLWFVLAAYTYSFNGYLGIAVIAIGTVIFYILRRNSRKAVEKNAPKEGLYTGLQYGVIYRTQKEIDDCIAALKEKSDADSLEYDFSWDEEKRAASLALYCPKGGLRNTNFPSSFVVSFSKREEGVWILVHYLDSTAKTSVMTRPEIDGFLLEKCEAQPIGMRKPPQK